MNSICLYFCGLFEEQRYATHVCVVISMPTCGRCQHKLQFYLMAVLVQTPTETDKTLKGATDFPTKKCVKEMVRL